MKSINFQRNKSLIRVVNEPGKKTAKRNWDKLIYISLLVILLIFGIYYFITKGFFVHAQGQVLIDETHIRLTDDVRLLEYKVIEGDSISLGDTLFCYAFGLDKVNGTATIGTDGAINLNSGGSQDMWWFKESFNIKKKIVTNKIQISKNIALIASYEKEIKRLTNEVVLDVLPKTRLDYAQTQILNLKTENSKLSAENIELGSLAGTLHPFDNKGRVDFVRSGGSLIGNGGYSFFKGGTVSNFSGEILSEPKFFRAPLEGIVTRVYIRQHETALKAETILTIHKRYPTTIKAFFEQSDLRYFKVGDIFTLNFPDGSESLGILRRFYIATYNMPEEFQKKYESTTRALAADIYPLNKEESDKWRAFHKMSVEITKFKFN